MGMKTVGTEVGGIIVGWLLKVSLAIVVISVLAFDGVSMAYSAVTTEDDARAVARSAAAAVFEQRPPAQILVVAEETAAERGVSIPAGGVLLSPDGQVTVTVQRTANTLVLHHISALQQYLDTEATSTFRTQ